MPFVQAITTFASLRNDYTGNVGMKITTVSPCIVTHLGRWIVPGNSAAHAVVLKNSISGVLGTVSVVTSGAPVGAFLYVALATPVVLAAGTDYFLESTETNGGDQFYDLGNVLVPSAIATIPGSAVDFSTGGSANNCFGPVSFIYSI
jgi:hypothetical protein